MLIIASGFVRCTTAPSSVPPPEPGQVSEIVYAGDMDYFPYESLDEDGDPTGFNVELAQAIGEVLGAEVTVQLMPWEKVKEKVRKNEIDLACFFYTPARDSFANFAFYHNLVYHHIVTRRGEFPNIGLDGLTERSVLVQRESGAAEYLQSNYPGVQLTLTDTETEALERLNAGQYDCAVVSQYQTHQFIKELTNRSLVPRGSPVIPMESAFVVPNGREELLSPINQAIAYLRATGRYSQLYLKYFGITERDITQRIVQIALWVIAPLMAGLLLAVLWSQSLRGKVRTKTSRLQRELVERRATEARLRENEAVLKQTKAQLEAKNAALKKANDELDNFVYSSSHDMRAPLASTLGLIQVMRTEPPQNWSHDYLGLIEKSTRRLELFTEEVITYTANKKLSVELATLDLSEVIGEAFNHHRYLNPDAAIELRTNLHDNGHIRSDVRRIEIILNNLISNAIKYHDHRKEHCYVRVEALHQAQQVIIRVEDNGQGIHPEYQGRIFDMFVQATDRPQGSGLGLYIVREAVHKLQGSISVASALGQGTTFTVTLPV